MTKLKVVLVLVALMVACRQEVQTPENTPTPYTPPILSGEWTVSMRQSGGIMGMLQSVTVTFDGKYSAKDERTGNEVNGKLAEGQLSELQTLAAILEFSPPENPAVCADCFVYEVKIQSDGKKMIAQADDVSLQDSGMGPLVELLREIMDAALK